MSKGSILTCGYFSLNSVIKTLAETKYNIIKVGKVAEANNLELQKYYIDETQDFFKCVDDNIPSEEYQQINLNDFKMFSVGDAYFINNPVFSSLVVNEIIGGVIVINSAYDYLVKANKKHNIKAILLHISEGARYGTLVEVGKDLGIPTFCCYNGIHADYLSKYNAHQFYSSADYYYLSGNSIVDWIKARDIPYTDEKMILTGHPSFDLYYEGGKIIHSSTVEDNTFLYSAASTPSITMINHNLMAVFDKVDSSLVHKAFPHNIDVTFFRAFAKYQKEINPTAKLIISLRPYFPIDSMIDPMDVGVKNYQIVHHDVAPINQLFSRAKYMVGCSSTTLIEAIINRKPTLNITGMFDCGSYNFPSDLCIKTRGDVNSIMQGLVDLVEREDELVESCNDYAAYYNFKDDGKAGRRICDHLVERIGK